MFGTTTKDSKVINVSIHFSEFSLILPDSDICYTCKYGIW